jgi:hypothetical protein
MVDHSYFQILSIIFHFLLQHLPEGSEGNKSLGSLSMGKDLNMSTPGILCICEIDTNANVLSSSVNMPVYWVYWARWRRDVV